MLNEIDLSRADLNLLVLFDVVLQELHVGRSAERLNLSASAVSHSLGRLRTLLNDPLFLRTPKGVVPTERALSLAEPVRDILASARRVISSAEPFDPATSNRSFTIGAPDAISVYLLPSLLQQIQRTGPGINIGFRNLLPTQGSWANVFADLDTRSIDVAILPFISAQYLSEAPARFVMRELYEEKLVTAMRSGHPYHRAQTLKSYCDFQHISVSSAGDQGIDSFEKLLAAQGMSMRISLTVPNFMAALAVVAETNLLASVPKRFFSQYAEKFGVVSAEIPFLLETAHIRAVTPRVALMDKGIVWLLDMLEKTRSA